MESEKKNNVEDTCWINEMTPSVVSKNSKEDCVSLPIFEISAQ